MTKSFDRTQFIWLVQRGTPMCATVLLQQAIDSGSVVFPCGTNNNELTGDFAPWASIYVLDEEIDGETDECDNIKSRYPAFEKEADMPAGSFPLGGIQNLLSRCQQGEHPLLLRYAAEVVLPLLFPEQSEGGIISDGTVDYEIEGANQICYPFGVR